jgi:hypothetical protein
MAATAVIMRCSGPSICGGLADEGPTVNYWFLLNP